MSMVEVTLILFCLQNDLTNQKRHDIIVMWGVTNAHYTGELKIYSDHLQTGTVSYRLRLRIAIGSKNSSLSRSHDYVSICDLLPYHVDCMREDISKT